jgi:hypothetical protein
MARRNPRRNITRIEKTAADGTICGGWEVRIQRQRQSFNRYFSDSISGGKNAALRAAKQFRDQIENSFGRMSTEERAEQPSARNQSGVVGVQLKQHKRQHGDYEYTYLYWVAQWTDGRGQRKTRAFSVNKFGDAEAFRLAWEAREEGVHRARR